jgi:hypothetical protein
MANGGLRLTGVSTNGLLRTSGNNGTIAVDTNNYTSTSNNLSVFATTSSAQLAGVLSDETGTGAVVFSTSPNLTAPALSSPSIAGQITLPVSRTTMSANVILTPSSSSYQFFDTNGADRDVRLPPATTGMSFVIYNYSAGNNILLKDTNGNTVTVVPFGNKFATVVFDGIAWRLF